MENIIPTKNANRRPFAVLYSSDVNRPTETGKDENVETAKARQVEWRTGGEPTAKMELASFGGGDENKVNMAPFIYQDENAIAFDDVADKSRSSIMCVSMQSATVSLMQTDCSSIQAEDKRRDVVLSCRDYVEDVLSYLLDMEKRFRAKPHYMRKQPQLNPEMRSILIDWLVDVTCEYDLQQETLHLAIGYTDRFLSTMAVRKEHLQLVGIASMMIAAKYEEIYPPELQEFVYITDDTYSRNELLQMEQIILKTLDFNLSTPTAFIFLVAYLSESKAGQRCQCLAKYLCDLALMDYSFLAYTASLVAASCTYLAHYMTDSVPVMPQFGNGPVHKIGDISSCSEALLKVFKGMPNCPQQAIRDKYKADRFCRVALLEAPDSLPPVS